MTIFEAFILGVVQSLTEFFPVSSSAHLVILPSIMGWDVQSLTFDLVLHMGTSLALIIFFWKDLWHVLCHFFYDVFYNSFRNKKIIFTPHSKFGLYLLVGTIPASLIGFLYNDYIENNVRDLKMITLFLIFGTLLLIIAEIKARKKSSEKELNFFKALFIGFFQALALLPGVSRSGATISGGILNGLSREKAARFAFMLAIPVILGGGILKISQDFYLLSLYPYEMLTAFLASFVFGLLALRLLMLFLKKGDFVPFIVYRVILIIFLLYFNFRQ